MIAYDLYIFYTIEFNDKDVSIPTGFKEISEAKSWI